MRRLLHLGLLLAANPVVGAGPCHAPDDLALRHALASYVVVLRDPRCLPGTGMVWQSVSVADKAGGEEVRLARPDPNTAAGGYMPDEDEGLLFSPDGAFLTLYYGYGRDSGAWSRVFIDLEKRRWTDFLSSDGKHYATIDNFEGWVTGEPHTALLLGDVKAQPLDY